MSTFTALNGGSPKTSDPPTLSAEKSTASDERANSTAPAQPQPTPEPSSNQRSAQISDRPAFQSPNYPDVDGSHKRKRSDSLELRRESLVQERTPETTAPTTQVDSREPYGTPQRDYRHYGDEQRDKDGWYTRRDDQSYDSQQNSATTPHGQTEEQIGDALRRAAGQMDHGDYPQTSPEMDDRSINVYGGQYTPEHRRDGVMQHDPKKRKRNFSNRTKTGCLTCRKRKKKCDEQKPECKFQNSSYVLEVILMFLQAATVSVVVLCVLDTRPREALDGKSPITRPPQFLSSPRTRATCPQVHMACRSKIHTGPSR